jgi:hypothetical protein
MTKVVTIIKNIMLISIIITSQKLSIIITRKYIYPHVQALLGAV